MSTNDAHVPLLPRLARQYARRELPAWGRVLDAIGIRDKQRWQNAGHIKARGKWHNYELDLDLANWSDRFVYFVGRHSDLPSQLALRALLGRDETLIDIGANIGLMTLLGASVVGEKGRVIAFEPNPVVVERLRTHIRDNHLNWVTIHDCALAEQESVMQLSVVDNACGCGTLRALDHREQQNITQQANVQVKVGDKVLSDFIASHKISLRPVTLKIDIEGYEIHALSGLTNFFDTVEPAVLFEADETYLKNAGGSARELLKFFWSRGYLTGELDLVKTGLGHYNLTIAPVTTVPAKAHANMVAWKPNSPHAARLAPFLKP